MAEHSRLTQQLVRDGLAGCEPESHLPWRDHLKPAERTIIEAAEAAKAEWLRLNAMRAGIVNRAIQRAKYAAQRKSGAAA